jgi:nicotinate-nucleotide adenylyltransferase
MSRVGILGGTFDPPHNAHVMMANEALSCIPLDRVLLMPAPRPPHKQDDEVTPFDMRVEMIQLAIEGYPGLEVSLAEEHTAGLSYTVDLLEFYRQNSSDEVFLVVGADSVGDLPSWKDPSSIMRLSTLVVFPRTGYAKMIPVDGDASIILFEAPVIDVSSTEIRQRVRAGEPVASMLPKAVHEFILDNSLYS